jgi:hypothetical protein
MTCHRVDHGVARERRECLSMVNAWKVKLFARSETLPHRLEFSHSVCYRAHLAQPCNDSITMFTCTCINPFVFAGAEGLLVGIETIGNLAILCR